MPAPVLDVAETRDAPVVALLKVARSEMSKYGIVDAKAAGDRLYELHGMVEKPPPEKAPSDFAIMGRYVLTPDIFDLLAAGKPGAGGEIQLTDALMALASGARFTATSSRACAMTSATASASSRRKSASA